MELFDSKAPGRDSSDFLEIRIFGFTGVETSKQVNLNMGKYFVSNVFTISKKYLIKRCEPECFDILHKMAYRLQIQQKCSSAVVF